MSVLDWDAALVGPWMPTDPTASTQTAAQRHWAEQAKCQEDYAGQLGLIANRLGRNRGVTADDLIARYRQGAALHLSLAEKCAVKAAANGRCADQIIYLAERLRGIAAAGATEIRAIMARRASVADKIAAIEAVEDRCHRDAASASRTAVAHIVEETQRVLSAEGVATPARQWMREQGFDPEAPAAATTPIGAVALSDVRSAAAAAAQQDPGAPAAGQAGSESADAALTDVRAGAPVAHTAGQTASEPAAVGDVRTPTQAARPAAVSAPETAGAAAGLHTTSGGQSVPPVGGGVPTVGTASGPAGTVETAHMPDTRAALSPHGVAGEMAAGESAGRPAATAGESVAAAAVHAAPRPAVDSAMPLGAPSVEAATRVGPQVMPAAVPTAVGGGPGGAAVTGPHSAAPAMIVPSAVVGPPLPAMPLPPAGAPAIPPGPVLPYGADLTRGADLAPRSTGAVPAGPVGGAATAAGGSGLPAAGSGGPPLVSSRPVTGSSVPAASLAAAAGGAVAGTANAEALERYRLDRIVAAVARQDRRLAWAAGIREDGTTVLATDLAGGWIPPHVVVPAGVRLLAPAGRRRELGAVELLGATTLVAEHRPHGYVPPSTPDDPVLDDAARQGAAVAELGPTFVEVARRLDVPRLVVTAAAHVTRAGLAADEADELRRISADTARQVMAVYRPGGAVDARAWMLLAAIEALIMGRTYAAHHHLRWAESVTTTDRKQR